MKVCIIVLLAFLAGCVANVKKEYVPMVGASPILKEQALAQCDIQAEQIAQQRYQQELATYNQRSQQVQPLFNTTTTTTANCYNTGGSNFNCTATSHDNSGMNQLLVQVAAGRAPQYLGARNSDIERCMRGMGYVLVEIKPLPVRQPIRTNADQPILKQAVENRKKAEPETNGSYNSVDGNIKLNANHEGYQDASKVQLSLILKDETWVNIKNIEGQTLLNEVVSAGKTLNFSSASELKVLVGRASAIKEIYVNGQPYNYNRSVSKNLLRFNLSPSN
jgi:hypothetical protein